MRNHEKPFDEGPSPFHPDWKEYFLERNRYIDGLFMHEEKGAQEWIVEGLIPRGYLVLLAGKPKDGKTCFATALGVAVAQGLPFAGMNTTKTTVLYFCCEESPNEWEIAIRPHMPKFVEGLGVAFARLAIDNRFDLSALRMKIHRHNVGLIVIDPLLAASVQGDFGNSGRARNALAGLKTLCRETNCAAIVVHHAKERRGRAFRAAENPQLAATASLNIVLNWRAHPKGRLVTLEMTGRGDFANQTLKFVSPAPCDYAKLPKPRKSTSTKAPKNGTEKRHVVQKGT